MRSRIAAERRSPAALERRHRRRRDVEPARLQHHRHDRQPGQRIVRGRRRRFPQPVMRRQRAIAGAERPQPPVEQGEMHRLVGADAEPVVDEVRAASRRRTGRPCRRRGRSRRTRYGRARAASRSGRAPIPPLPRFGIRDGRQQLGPRRPRRPVGHRERRRRMRERAAPPGPRRRPRGLDLGARLGGQQHRAAGGGDRFIALPSAMRRRCTGQAR